MHEECLICKAPLEYLAQDEVMECALCRKKQISKTRCVNGHFVCDACHMSGMDELLGICLDSLIYVAISVVKTVYAILESFTCLINRKDLLHRVSIEFACLNELIEFCLKSSYVLVGNGGILCGGMHGIDGILDLC